MQSTTTAPLIQVVEKETVEARAVRDVPVDRWHWWQKIPFRLAFVYLLLQASPWNWLNYVPGMPLLNGWIGDLTNWAVHASNAKVFRIFDVLVMPNGSGDTSWSWIEMLLYLSVAAVAAAIWSAIDFRRPNYNRALYWLRLIVRYYIAIAALSYGIIKIFALQMVFPSMSQMVTPLGDLLPMRLSWLFIGYSEPYQMFSGAIETIAGLLLLYRRTVTLGLFVAAGAFANVLMINLSYDVPVKLYASHLFLACMFLLALDARRLISFLVLNRNAGPTNAYDFPFTGKWKVWGARGLKALMLYQFLWLPMNRGWERYQNQQQPPRNGPIANGMYEVESFVVNGDTIEASANDSLRWKDVIIDTDGAGSINTRDTRFWQRYRRGYFRYRTDTSARTMSAWRTSFVPRDSSFLFTMRYALGDSGQVRLAGLMHGDSVNVTMRRVNRHFQLSEKQFHWLSEYNR